MAASRKRALQNYRDRLGVRGLARFEVLGRAADRALIRELARRLAEDDAEALQLRAVVSGAVGGEAARKGGVLAALRRGASVAGDRDVTRVRDEGRAVSL